MLTKSKIKNAGKVLRADQMDTPEYNEAYDVLSDYRQAHEAVLRVVNRRCRKIIEEHFIKPKRCSPDDFFVAQRLKRLEAIVVKLKRFPEMGLETMQDIGGIRVMLPTLEDVQLFIQLFPGKRSPIVVKKTYDYLMDAKDDGYRSFHYVLEVPNPKSETLPHLKVELQVRTNIQHGWATAVEVAGFIEHQSFKTGEGDENWKRFFVKTSDVLSEFENVSMNEFLKSSRLESLQSIVDLNKKYGFLDKLFLLQKAIENHSNRDLKKEKETQRILILDLAAKEVYDYPESILDDSIFQDYFALKEKEFQRTKTGHILRIRVDNVNKSPQAYASYYLNISIFLLFFQELIESYKSMKKEAPTDEKS
jgi:ppGpp synthetase/RelA/SpoT-type nucleotidyltranferase